jgi:hypothetical protein
MDSVIWECNYKLLFRIFLESLKVILSTLGPKLFVSPLPSYRGQLGLHLKRFVCVFSECILRLRPNQNSLTFSRIQNMCLHCDNCMGPSTIIFSLRVFV